MSKILITITGIIILISIILGLAIADQETCLCPSITVTEYVDIGYVDCYKDDGSGPWHECGIMEVRCYDERGGELIDCPVK